MSEQEEGVITEIAEGVVSGLIGLPQGIAETVGSIVDYTADTNFTPEITDSFNAARDFLGVDPETAAGKTVESIVTFGTAFIPVAGWMGRASSVANGARVLPATSAFSRSATKFGQSSAGKALLSGSGAFSRRARLAATTSLAGGAAEFLVAPDGTGTLADAFSVLPEELRTVDESGLLGRDAARQTLSNKFKIGVEAAGIGLAAEAIFPAVGAATTLATMIPGVPTAASAISKGFGFLGNTVVPRVVKDGFTKYFTPAAGLDAEVFESLSAIKNITRQEAEYASQLLTDFDKQARKVVKKQGVFAKSKGGVQKAMDDLLLFLEGDKDALNSYGQEVVSIGTKMRGQVDRLTDMAITSLQASRQAGDIDSAIADVVIKEMEKNKGAYLRRLYEQAFVVDPKILKNLDTNPKYRAGVDRYARILQKSNPEMTTEEAVSAAKQQINDVIVRGKLSDSGLSPEALLELQKRGFEDVTSKAGRTPLIKVSEAMFSKRGAFLDQVPEIRQLMGEIRDPRKLYLSTIGDMSKTIMANDFYQSLASRRVSFENAVPELDSFLSNGSRGSRPLVISGENANEELLRRAGYVKLGSRKSPEKGDTIFAGEYGALSGDFVQKEIYNAITQPVRSSNIMNELLAVSLLAKGLSQMGKTVLNPVGQMRNFLSGTFMVGANGNIPRHVELDEALSLAYGKVSGLSNAEFDKFHKMIGDLGLRDENLASEEYKALLREASGMKSEKLAASAGSLLSKMPGVQFAQKIYADTDTYWKTVGMVGEISKYGSALRSAGIDTENITPELAEALSKSGLGVKSNFQVGEHGFLNVLAADIVKETMPTYSRVPEIIKGIRRIPVAGNFVAFPAEVIRNSVNIVSRAVKDMSFRADASLRALMDPKDVARLERQIRSIGANRLASYTASAYVIPTAVVKSSLMANDMSEEDLNKLRKFGLPDYMQGQQIALVEKPDKKGDFIFANLSYMMPFDFALAPARRALEIYERKGEMGRGEVEQVASAMWGAFSSFMEPFAGESLVAERLQDALPVEYFGRGGQTVTGAPVWSASNDAGTKFQKGMLHVLGGFNPEITRMFFDVKEGDIVPGRVSLAMTGDPSAAGRTFTPAEEALSFIAGIRPQKGNVFKSIMYEGYGFTDLRSSATGSFTRVAKANDSTNEDVIEAYLAANNDALRIQQDMYAKIQGAIDFMESSGMSRRKAKLEVMRALRTAKVGKSERFHLMTGRFRPITISDQVVKDVWRETSVQGEPRKINRLPLRSLARARRILSRQRLDAPEPEVQEPVSEAPAAPTTQPAPIAPTAQATPTANLGTSTPAPTLQTANVDPSLLGDNPVEALRNLQIAQRTRA